MGSHFLQFSKSVILLPVIQKCKYAPECFFCICVYLCVAGEVSKLRGLMGICNILLLPGNPGKFAISEQTTTHLISTGRVIWFYKSRDFWTLCIDIYICIDMGYLV